MFDLGLFSVVAGLLIAIFAPRALSVTRRFGGLGSQVVLQMIVLFGWVFAESSLLSFFGTTPGKSLFRARLMLGENQSIPYSMALIRSFKVWWRGLGAGFPFINLLTLTHAETDLTANSITSWDREGGFVVTHEKIGTPRLVIATICLGVFFVLGAVVTFVALAQ
jgi:RDD family